MLVTWSGGDTTQVVRSKIRNEECELSPKERSEYAELFDVDMGPVEAELRRTRQLHEERVKSREEQRQMEKEMRGPGGGTKPSRVSTKRGTFKAAAEFNRQRLDELTAMVEHLERKSGTVQEPPKVEIKSSSFELTEVPLSPIQAPISPQSTQSLSPF